MSQTESARSQLSANSPAKPVELADNWERADSVFDNPSRPGRRTIRTPCTSRVGTRIRHGGNEEAKYPRDRLRLDAARHVNLLPTDLSQGFHEYHYDPIPCDRHLAAGSPSPAWHVPTPIRRNRSRSVVPNAAGGPTDALARGVGEKLAARLGQTVVIENRAGAASIVGAQAVARAQPDGYTLLLSTTGVLALNPNIHAKLPYDASQGLRAGRIDLQVEQRSLDPQQPAKSRAWRSRRARQEQAGW